MWNHNTFNALNALNALEKAGVKSPASSVVLPLNETLLQQTMLYWLEVPVNLQILSVNNYPVNERN